MIQLLKQQITAQLQALGWTAIDSTALAFKEFATAVGTKTAHVYLAEWKGEANAVLEGDYQSEGRNILEPWSRLVPKDADADIVRALVTQFVQHIERTVLQSYAAALHAA